MIENIRLSFQGIFGHKMRSFLTMLGIIIGIAAIIAIVSTIKGTNDQIKDNLVGSGNNLVNVKTWNSDWEVIPGEGYDMSALPIINDKILDEIKDIPEVVDAVIYHRKNMWENISYKGNNVQGMTLYGVKSDYINIKGYTVAKGRCFNDNDITLHRNVVILDRDAEYSLFQGEDSINKSIEIKGVPFTVVGIVDELDKFAPTVETISDWYTYYGDSQMGAIMVNDAVWPVVSSFDEPYQVIVRAGSTEEMTQAGKSTADIINNYINPNIETELRYKSDNTLEKAKQLQELSNQTSKQLIWIAGISLIVGGIGVMNIMLVSVTERTREIGLKKALGARRRSILGQFLTEAAVLTSIGGLLGVGAGIGLAYLISKIAAVPVSISVPAIVVSVIFSMVIGIIFGLIPSIKASKLNPIDALRYE